MEEKEREKKEKVWRRRKSAKYRVLTSLMLRQITVSSYGALKKMDVLRKSGREWRKRGRERERKRTYCW